jgi:hypothetical protein
MAVWGSGATDAWAVGCWGSIAHWDGNTWSPWPSPTNENLIAVSGAAPNDVWAAGYAGTVVHWDGMRWSVQKLPAVDWWGSNCQQGGTSCTGIGWESTEWWLVSSTAPNDVWLVGTSLEGFYTDHPQDIAHWNGVAWSDSFAGGWVFLNGIWGSSPRETWAVGQGGVVLRKR